MTLPSKATKYHLTVELGVVTGERDVAREVLDIIKVNHMAWAHIEPEQGESQCWFCGLRAKGVGKAELVDA